MQPLPCYSHCTARKKKTHLGRSRATALWYEVAALNLGYRNSEFVRGRARESKMALEVFVQQDNADRFEAELK